MRKKVVDTLVGEKGRKKQSIKSSLESGESSSPALIQKHALAAKKSCDGLTGNTAKNEV